MKNILAALCAIAALHSTAMAQITDGLFMHRLGEITITQLSEGSGQGNRSILVGASDQMMESYAPDGKFATGMNAFLVRTPGQTILIDTGIGRNLQENLKTLKVTPAQVDAILLTHTHGDHIGGLMADGKALFPKAVVWLSEAEYAFWSAQAKSKQILDAYQGRVKLFKPGQVASASQAEEILPGIRALSAYGHTPGHVMFLLTSGRSRLLVWGDVAHAMAIQMPHPEVSVTYDSDPVQAARSRQEVLKWVAAKRIPIAGMHVASPAMGEVSALGQGRGYNFTPLGK